MEPALTLLSRDPIQDFHDAGRPRRSGGDGHPHHRLGLPDDRPRRPRCRTPRLRYVLHAAGSVKHHIGDACWERGIQVSSAADANAIPVAEYTVAMIILANKRVLQIARALHTTRTDVLAEQLFPDMGNYRQTCGHHWRLEDRPARDPAPELL